MSIIQYKRDLSELQKRLDVLYKEYNKPDSEFEDPETNRITIKKQIDMCKKDINSIKENIDIYNEAIELIEKYGDVRLDEREKAKKEIFDLMDKLPEDLAYEIDDYITEVAERKSKEQEVLDDVRRNIRNVKYEFVDDSKEKNNAVNEAQNVKLPIEVNSMTLSENTNDDIELNGLDDKLNILKSEIIDLEEKISESKDSKEKESLNKNLEDKKKEFNDTKTNLLNLLNEYKDKFNKEYEDLNLIYAGEEILSRKYRDNKEKIDIISKKINEINDKKKRCFNNQSSVEELIEKYTNYNIKSIKKPEIKKDKILKIDKKEHKPKLTWKTAVAIASGIGVGATVYFTLGPLGVTVLNAAAGISKGVVSKKQANSNIDYNKERIKIKEVNGMSDKLKSSFKNLKTYLKSKEGLRDISWFLTSAIITGTTLSIGNGIKNYFASKSAPTTIDNPIKDVPNNINKPTVTPSGAQKPSIYSNIKIQNGIGNYDVSSGYDRASWALNNTNKESLISEYVNKAKSVFNKFVVLNSDGTIGAQCTTPGMSIEQFAQSQGVDVSKVAVLVSDKAGTAQAWTAASELVKSIGVIK